MTLLNLDPEPEWKKKFPLNIFMQSYTNEILIHYRATSRERDVTHVKIQELELRLNVTEDPERKYETNVYIAL